MTGSFIRKLGLDALYFSGVNDLLRPFAQGVGAVLVLHHVRPVRPQAFQPNRFLEITPEFLEQTIKWLAYNSYQFVSLDEARTRLVERRCNACFVAITFDDGFRDNKVWAQPILAKYGVPYTIFIATDFAEGDGHLWWLALESIVARQERIELDGGFIPCATLREKLSAYAALKGTLLRQPNYFAERLFICELAERYHFDHAAATRTVCMTWDEIRELSEDPLASIGAHTVSHPILAKESEVIVRAELADCRAILEHKLQRDIRHFAYPFGSIDAAGPREFKLASELGYQTAVTTRIGVVKAGDAGQLMQLPRITMDGTYQRERYLDVLLSGVAPAAWNGIRRALRPVADHPVWAQ